MSEIRPVTGACPFCGQQRIVEMSEDEWLTWIQETNKDAEELANEVAADQCHCREGQEWRSERKVLEHCRQNIEAMFREKNPEIADVLQEARPLIWSQKLKRLSVTTHEGGVASIYRTGGNIEIKFLQKSETKLTASY